MDRKFTETYTPEGNQLPDFMFLDTRVETPRFNVSANFATFTKWSPTVTKLWVRIDFVLGGSNRRWYVYFSRGQREPCLAFLRLTCSHRVSTACKVGAGMSDDGMMHSDHRPVFVDFDI